RRTVRPAARTERRRVEGIDLGGRPCAQANMRATFVRHLAHRRAKIDPELRISLAKADSSRARHEPRQPEHSQRRLVETRGAFEVGNADGDVIDHAGAPDLTSL